MHYSWPIIGHHTQLNQLEKELSLQKISHAYLFSGPDKLGKFRIIKTMAQILQCQNSFCKNCPDCKQIEKEQHLDTIFFRDAGQIIAIEEIRKMQEVINLKVASAYRLILLENIERMPIPSQNAFLKILEEPPPRTIFLLTTNALSDLLPTILSRVRLYNFQPLPISFLKEYLQEKIPEDNIRIKNILALAQGKIGVAIELANDLEAYEKQLLVFQTIETFLEKKDLAHRFRFVEEIHKSPEEISNFLNTLLLVLRNHLSKTISNPTQAAFSQEYLVNLIEKNKQSARLIQKNVNKRLVLEDLLLCL